MSELRPGVAAWGGEEAPKRVARLLEQAAPRRRVVDEHVFALPSRTEVASTCRVQVFVGEPTVRPVVVATQTTLEGLSLSNGVERYMAAAWQRYLPEESDPPIFIQRQLLNQTATRFQAVTFAERAGRYEVGSPSWCPLTDAQVDQLVGQPVDRGRGDGYVARPLEPGEQPVYLAMPVIRLPRPEPFRADDCMPAGTPAWRRWARQLAPDRSGDRGCCWYHGGNWHTVCATAIRLALAAQRAGTAPDDIANLVLEQAEAEGLAGWPLQALETLVSAGDAIWLSGDRYGNGQHRAQAMLDTGVRRTLVVRWHVPTDQ